MDPVKWRLWGGKSTIEVIESRCFITLQHLSSLGNWVQSHKHGLVHRFHLPQFCLRGPGTRTIEEGTKVENARRDFWNGKTKFGMEAEDATDEIVGFRGDRSSSQEVVINEHEFVESSAVN